MTSYKAIKSNILSRIVAQEWKLSDVIPKEELLAKEYQCARATINRALRELADEGYLERRRKSGTRVARKESRSALFTIPLIRRQIEQIGRKYRYLLIERSIVEGDYTIVGDLDVPAGARVLYLKCLHYADGTPYQLENRWINLEAVPNAENQDFETVSPNEWLVQEIPYTRAEHVFKASTAASDEKELLKLQPTEPVFVIERRTWLADASITYVRMSHPGNSYRQVSRDVDHMSTP